MREGRRRVQRSVSYAEHQDEEDDDNGSDDDVAPVTLGVADGGDVKHDQRRSNVQEKDEDQIKGKSKRAHSTNASSKLAAGKSKMKKQQATGSAAAVSDGASATSGANKVADEDEDDSEPDAEFEMNEAGDAGAEKDDADGESQEDADTSSPLDGRSVRSSRTSRRAASGGDKLSTQTRPAPTRRGTRVRQTINYTSQMETEETGDARANDEDDDDDDEVGDEEGEEDVAERRKKRARGRGGRVAVKQATSKGKKSAPKKKDKTENPLNEFGFQPITSEDHQAQVDWNTKTEVSSSKRAKKARNATGSSKASKGRADSGAPPKDNSQRRSSRRIRAVESERLNYAEPESSMEDGNGEGDDGEEEGEEEDEEGEEGEEDGREGREGDEEEDEDGSEGSYEDDALPQKKRKRSSTPGKAVAKVDADRGTGGKGGRKGTKGKGKSADAESVPGVGKQNKPRRSGREKVPVVKGGGMGTRKSSREKAAVDDDDAPEDDDGEEKGPDVVLVIDEVKPL